MIDYNHVQNYGAQAVVVSIDPKRVYVENPATVPHKTIRSQQKGPNQESYVWWQCTVKGGREPREIGAIELAQAVEELGAGEILLNCIDKDGQVTLSSLDYKSQQAGPLSLPPAIQYIASYEL